MMEHLLDNYNYWISVVLMMIGFYGVINGGNLVKKLIGMSIFQTAVLLLYIDISKIRDGASPILRDGVELYTNPLPHVLMLTAIVVGVATLAVGLAIIVRIKEAYGTIEEDELLAIDNDTSVKETRKRSTVMKKVPVKKAATKKRKPRKKKAKT